MSKHTFAASPTVFVEDDARIRVMERPVHGPGVINVHINSAAADVLSLNLSPAKAAELHSALGRLVNTLPQSWADLQADALVIT